MDTEIIHHRDSACNRHPASFQGRARLSVFYACGFWHGCPGAAPWFWQGVPRQNPYKPGDKQVNRRKPSAGIHMKCKKIPDNWIFISGRVCKHRPGKAPGGVFSLLPARERQQGLPALAVSGPGRWPGQWPGPAARRRAADNAGIWASPPLCCLPRPGGCCSP